MKPIRDKPYFSVALPSSLLEGIPTLRERTFRAGIVGRALAIFRVEEVIIFRDPLNANPSFSSSLLATLLNYQETPQYLRKMLFPKDPRLRYAGLLPPLRTPHHPLKGEITQYREGVIVRREGDRALVDVGLDEYIRVKGAHWNVGTRVTVKLFKDGRSGKVVNKNGISIYWGFKVKEVNYGLKELMLNFKNKGYLILATSKYGSLINKVYEVLKERLKECERILLVFGSAKSGLYDMARAEGIDLNSLSDYVINFVPRQGCKTIRSEEALVVALSILNFLKYIK